MLHIPRLDMHTLEMHVAHACNLTCESCGHYSNQGHKGIVSIQEGEEWMAGWHRRVEPRFISLLGGEPTLHPELSNFVRMTKKMWPHTQIRITTNGFFLHRHPDLPKALEETDTELQLSIHDTTEEYQNKIKEVKSLIQQWKSSYKFRDLTWTSINWWFKQYKGFGDSMMPYEDNDPKKSWEVCKWKTCMQLFEGHLWKCAPLAYLHLQKKYYNLHEKWNPYLNYKSLPPSCTYAELKIFLNREEESACTMCPANPEHFKPMSVLTPLGIVKRTKV